MSSPDNPVIDIIRNAQTVGIQIQTVSEITKHINPIIETSPLTFNED